MSANGGIASDQIADEDLAEAKRAAEGGELVEKVPDGCWRLTSDGRRAIRRRGVQSATAPSS